MIELQPLDFRSASEFIRQHHRHHLPMQGWKFGIGATVEDRVVGVVAVGRPVARGNQDGWTLEVTRCCTDGTQHVASQLYAAAWRATRALGYRRLLTYTLASERGSSLKAAGWRVVGEVSARRGGWNTKSRPRTVKAPTDAKTLWEAQP